ncbi:MAG: hypothetical protein ABR595_10840 [Psychroflexus sp.]
MIDSKTKKPVIAVQKEDFISITLYSWGDLPILEDYLEDRIGIEIEFFKPIDDENGNEIGCELLYPNSHKIELIQNIIDEIQ